MKPKGKSKYKVGSQVKHISEKKWGKIADVWWDEREWRYEVRHSRLEWSVPEWALTTSRK